MGELLAHGLAVQGIRANARPGTKVGPAENITASVPVRGYFHWRVMDNFAWSGGDGTRSGRISVASATLQHMPKRRAPFDCEVTARNAVV